MDDFEYSVHISDQDWDSFFQECEGCDLLSPVLASREDSGMSDIDEMGCLFRSRNPGVGTASTDPDPDLQIDGPPDCEGSPVCNYLSKYGIRSPEQVLSGSEEDLHLQTVNLFFEQLKSVTENQQPLEQSHVVIRGSEKMGHLEGLIDKQDILPVDTGPYGRNKPSLREEITKRGVAHTWGDKASEKALKIISANAQEHASKSDTELVIGRKPLTTPLITVRMKQEQQGRYNGLSKDVQLTPETKPSDKEKMVVVIKKDMTDPCPATLDAISRSDSKYSPIGQIPLSPSRRKRRKKKRMSVEPAEQGHEAQIRYHQSESEEERFIQREEISNLPANVWKTEHLSLQRIKTPSIVHNTGHLQLRNTFDLEDSADFKFSKSLPLSFISDLGNTLPKPEVGNISFNTISESMHDTSLVNNGQLKAKICELSLLPQTDKVLNVKESGIYITESLQFDPAVRLRESRTGIGETLSAPLSDNSDAGCQRKSLLSPSVSSAVDSTEPPSSTVSFKLTENKDLSCFGNETDCSPLKNEQTIPSSCNIVEISATKESSLSLTDNIDRAESCSDGRGPETFTCSQEASQIHKACIHENISESQITKESSLSLTDNNDRAASCSDGKGPETLTCSQEASQKQKACIHKKISESQIIKESSLSLTDNIDRAESCSDGKGPETLTCSQEASQKQKACIHKKISESQIIKESSLSLTDNNDRAEFCSDGRGPETLTCSQEASQKQKACIHKKILESQIIKESSLSLTDNIDRAESCSDGKGPETLTCSQEASQKQKACIHKKILESQIIKESSLSLTDNNDRAEFCSDGRGPETFTCSQEASQKQKACIHKKISESQIIKESSLSLTDNNDRAEFCSDGRGPETFTCSQEASQKQKACIHKKISESQIIKESSFSLTDNNDRAESCSDGKGSETLTCSQEASQKQKACIHKKISESQIIKESSLSLTDNIDRAESCSDGKGPETLTCSQEASQKQKTCIHKKILESQIIKESSLSLTDNNDRAESCSDGRGPETFTCSQEASQKQKACIQENISESQSRSTSQTIEINTNIPVNEMAAKTESHISDNIDHETDEDHIQTRNKTSEVLIVNASPIKTGNSDESDDTRDISDNEVAVSTSEQLFCGKSIGSREDIHGPTEEMLGEDPTQDVSEFPQNMVAEIEDCSSSELKSEAKDLESVSLDASNQLPVSVFAISSFWNEMEKLTINDILRLRLISNAQHPSILTQPEDGSIVDTTDAADSGYFTQPDDSKLDRLSGDMSYISDLDEDLEQLQTPFPSEQEDKSSEWASRVPSSCGVMWENDPDPVVVGDEMVHISSETALPEHLYTANAQQCFRRMCKNMSVQNLQALDTQPIRQILRNASMHSIHSEVEDDFMDPFYHVNTSGSKIFSDDEEEMESSGVTFSEIIQFFFGEDEPERCASRADSVAASYLDGTGTSLPETYDHFFSEFDAIVEESGGDKMVPIFSCSRSANRNIQFPEAYDYFFPDSPGNSDEDDENDNTMVKVVTRYDYKSPNHDTVDMYEHFFSEDESDFLWTSPVSLRKVRRTGFTVPEEKKCSGELVPVKAFHKGIIQPINAMSPDGSPFPDSLLFNLENRIFQQLAEQQKKCMEMQTVVADPRLDAPFLPLKQADMCLVCIAFASWVLKSTGSGGDTWKAALLANVSALSAIRYLRRHKREEVSGKTPLHQIEPA